MNNKELLEKEFKLLGQAYYEYTQVVGSKWEGKTHDILGQQLLVVDNLFKAVAFNNVFRGATQQKSEK